MEHAIASHREVEMFDDYTMVANSYVLLEKLYLCDLLM